MGKVIADMSMSLDGFIAGPNDRPENPLGAGGEQIHEWVFELASWREGQGLDGGGIQPGLRNRRGDIRKCGGRGDGPANVQQ